MKNLKKVLALVLAFACAFTMFAGAAFTDQADISQTEAVDMLSALGVINGYTDGSFKPDATITRAQAAKMIYTIWNGGNDDASAFKWKSVFNDVYSGHWAEGYINFCYTNGIINGTSATTFSPEEALTGTQLAKMLLICMGYQADKSGLEGTGYSQRTNALATQNGLYTDVAASVSSAMPRQYAAQIMYNALKADTVEWSSDNNAYSKVTTSGLQWVENPNKADDWQLVSTTVNETMGKKCMGLDTIEDVRLFAVQQENGRDTYSLNDGAFTRVATDYSDLIGQRVNVMIKDDDRSKVYGVYADEDSSVIAEGVVGQLESDDDADKIQLNGTTYDLDANADQIDVYEVNKDTAAYTLDQIDDLADYSKAAWNIKLIDIDGDGDVNLAVAQKVTVAEVTYVNDEGIRVRGINNNSTIKFDENDVYEDAAKDDWAVVVDEDYTSSGDFVVTKADIVSGRVGSVHKDGNVTTEVRVDGTWYKSAIANDDTAIGANVDLVVYGDMYFDIDGSTASLDVAVVTGVGNWNNMDGDLEVRLMFKDGSEEVVDVDKLDDVELTSTAASSVKKDTMVAYDTDDGKYLLYTIKDGEDIKIGKNDTDHDGVVIESNWSYDDDRAVIEVGNSNYDIADSAMVVIKNSSDDYVYMTGEQLLDRNNINFTAGNDDNDYRGYLAVNDDGEVVALFGKTTQTISSGATNYGYIVDMNEAENADEDVKLYIDVITEDGLLENVETDEDSSDDFAIGMIITYTMDGDVMVIDEAENIHIDAIRNYTDTRVRFYADETGATGNSYAITSDTVIIAIEGSGDDAAEFVTTGNGALDNASEYTVDGKTMYRKNAAYILDGNDIEVIFVETDPDQDFVAKN